MVLDFLKSDSFHGVWLEHSVDQILHLRRQVVRDEVSALLDLAEELGHLVVIKWEGATDHSI